MPINSDIFCSHVVFSITGVRRTHRIGRQRIRIGFFLYARIVAELDVDVEAFAPDDYIPVQSERIDFYRRLAGCGSIEEIASVAAQVQEVYGAMPRPVQNLVSVARLKLLASSAGVSKVVVRPGRGELVFAQKQYMMNKKVFDALAESGA